MIRNQHPVKADVTTSEVQRWLAEVHLRFHAHAYCAVNLIEAPGGGLYLMVGAYALFQDSGVLQPFTVAIEERYRSAGPVPLGGALLRVAARLVTEVETHPQSKFWAKRRV